MITSITEHSCVTYYCLLRHIQTSVNTVALAIDARSACTIQYCSQILNVHQILLARSRRWLTSHEMFG